MIWKRKDVLIEESIVDYLENIFTTGSEEGKCFSVYVGTDSQKSTKRKGLYKFATVIIIRTFDSEEARKIGAGKGGIIISSTYNHAFKRKYKEAVNERMIYEVSKSVEAAYEIAEVLDLYEVPLEVHADINQKPEFESNKALQQAIGYILGMGYDFKVKPDAWASSNGADKIC